MNQDIEDVVPKGEKPEKVLLVDGAATRPRGGAAKLGVMLAAMEATVAASGVADFFKFPKMKMGNKYAPPISREKRAEIANFNAQIEEQKTVA